VIFEVLGDSSSGIAFVAKNHEYAAIRDILLWQEEIAGTMFECVADDWVGHLVNADGLACVPEIGIEVGLAKLYEGVEFPVSDDVPQSRW